MSNGVTVTDCIALVRDELKANQTVFRDRVLSLNLRILEFIAANPEQLKVINELVKTFPGSTVYVSPADAIEEEAVDTVVPFSRLPGRKNGAAGNK
jgi:hypothetical protein